MRMFALTVILVSVGLAAAPDDFAGKKPGEERTIAGIKLCWCLGFRVVALRWSR